MPYPDVLGIDRVNAVQLAIYRDGALVAPTESGSTFSLYSPDGTAIVNAAAVTVTGSIATYSILAALLDPDAVHVALGEGWQEVWSLKFGTVNFPFDREACLARRPIYPCITDLDLLAAYPQLAATRGASVTSFQGFIDEAWKRIILRWLGEGGTSYTVKSQYAFRTAHVELALALYFEHLSMSQANRGNFADLASKRAGAYDKEWSRINVKEDADHDGRVDDDSTRNRRGTVVHFNLCPEHRPNYMPRRRQW